MTQSLTTLPADRPRRSSWAFWLLALALGSVLTVGKLLQHVSAWTMDLDTGNYSNYAWGILHGQGFYGSVLGRHHLGEHFSVIMALIAPIYLVVQSAYVLLVIQAAAVTAGIMLLLRYAGDRLAEAGFGDDAPRTAPGGLTPRQVRLGVGAFLFVLMMLYPPLLATWATQFQPIELGFPLVIAAAMLMHARPSRLVMASLAVVVLLLLMTRESAPLSVLGLAVYAAAIRRRWALAGVLAVVALAWGAVTMGLLMPAFRDERRWGHVRHLGWAGMPDVKAFYLLAMFGGLGFLPFLGRNALWVTLAATPGLLLNLSVDRLPQVAFHGHYDAQTCAFTLMAAAHGAAWLSSRLFGVPADQADQATVVDAGVATLDYAGRGVASGNPAGPTRGVTRRDDFTAGLIAGALPATAAMLALCIVTVSHAKTVPEWYWQWRPDKARVRMAREAQAAAAEHAAAPALLGQGYIGPQVCHRPDYRSIRVGSEKKWREWAPNRVSPGSIFLLPGTRVDDDDGARHVVANSGWAVRLSKTPYLQVYKWPDDAPPLGSDELAEYVERGLEKAESDRRRKAEREGD